MTEQPPRFAARSSIIRDQIITDGAQRLYMLIDDIGWQTGECEVKQPVLADMLDVTVRSLQRRLKNLERGGYLELDRKRRSVRLTLGYVAELEPTKTAHRQSLPDATKMSRETTKMSHHKARIYISTDNRNTPLTPRKRGESPSYRKCTWCRGRGQRPGAASGTCPGCHGTCVEAA